MRLAGLSRWLILYSPATTRYAADLGPPGAAEASNNMKPGKQSVQSCLRKRVFVVDDHPMTRFGIVQLLNREEDLEVCGEEEDASRALKAIGTFRPDLVVTDLSMPGRHGIEFLKDMRSLFPEIPVLVVSMHDEEIFAERVLKAGARGYLMKDSGGRDLVVAVRRILGGRVFLSEAMADRALESLSAVPTQNRSSGIKGLTDREFEVVQCIGEGLSSREISEKLHMSLKTVETHRRHAREKLSLRSGAELVKFAVRWTSAMN